MQIAIMNYATSEVRVICGCPDEWDEEDIETHLYSEEGLDLRESDCFYMAGDAINLKQEAYKPKTKGG